MPKSEHIEAELITFNPSAVTVAAFSQTEQDLTALEAKHLNVHYPVETAEELALAEAALKEVKKYRTTLEAHRKSIKDPVLSYGKLIDSEAKRLNARILAIEEPLQAMIDAKKAEAERARQAAEQAALERLQEFDRMIDAIKVYPTKQAGKTAAEMQDSLVILREREPHIGKYFEKTGEALAAHIDAVKELEIMLEHKTKYEADQAELELLRKEKAEAQRNAELDKKDADTKPQTTQAPEAHGQVAPETSDRSIYSDTGAVHSVIVDLVAACQAALNEQPNLDCAWMLKDAIEGAKSI